jgi:hypothetical protein
LESKKDLTSLLMLAIDLFLQLLLLLLAQFALLLQLLLQLQLLLLVLFSLLFQLLHCSLLLLLLRHSIQSLLLLQVFLFLLALHPFLILLSLLCFLFFAHLLFLFENGTGKNWQSNDQFEITSMHTLEHGPADHLRLILPALDEACKEREGIFRWEALSIQGEGLDWDFGGRGFAASGLGAGSLAE